VSAPSGYTPYHPRWLRPRVSTYWWLERRSYLAFILRELSSVFVAWAVVYVLLLVRAVSHGEYAYLRFLLWSADRRVLLLNLLSLIFIVFHAITWFNLAPQAMVVHVGEKHVPPWLIAASNYVGWIVCSVLVVWLVVR
jgi:succinate dehydrogenase subunit C